jgi:hypothetical protein
MHVYDAWFPQDILVPHSSILLLFTASAQTHIFPEIRVDAVRFLDIYLEYFPDILVDGWKNGGHTHGGRILEGYLGLLNTSLAFGDTEGKAFLGVIMSLGYHERRPRKHNVNVERRLVTPGLSSLEIFLHW